MVLFTKDFTNPSPDIYLHCRDKVLVFIDKDLQRIMFSGNLELQFTVENYSSGIKQYAVYIAQKKEDIINNRIWKLLPGANLIDITTKEFEPDLHTIFFKVTAISKTNNESDANGIYQFQW